MDLGSEFCSGVLVGFLIAGILGFVLQQVRFAVKKVGDAGRPQQVKIDTEQTPAQVVSSSIGAGCWLVMIVLIVVALLWLALNYIA